MIEDLRSHLATHDKRLAFLFGAGTSSAVNIASPPNSAGKPKHEPLIPGTEGLTEICRTAVADLGDLQAAAWETIVEQCNQDGRSANVENILSKVQMKIDAIGEGESLLGLDRGKLYEIESKIRGAIGKTTCPPEEKIPQETPHAGFASWIKKVNRSAPVEIFTTNYDILFERAFEEARVPVFDGFVGVYHPFFYPECLNDDDLLPKSKWIRLWKLHGSVNWCFDDHIGSKRIIRTLPTESGEMILPSHRKYDESRKQPYTGYMDRLSQILNLDHSLLMTCGYSFNDEHINAILYGALDNRSTANIIALQFQDLNEDDNLIKEAVRCSNFTVIGPNGGVISGIWGEWQLTQPVDNKTCSFMDTAFDSNALPEDSGSPAATSTDLQGRIRLGDFNWFCHFLNAMGYDTP
ncbi:MAG: SIR2 family protein [Nitrospira sp.]|nr:SIR2 family protein [Nitrospira sp.]